LQSFARFGEVAAALQCAVVEAFVWERGARSELAGGHRASFRLSVSNDAYDAFFNAPAGYRGQYAVSPTAGEFANRLLLQQFEQMLVQYAASRSSVASGLVAASLGGAQAKIWIDEQEVELQLGNIVPDLVFPQWGQEVQGAGLLAPVGHHLEVKGGWLSARGLEIWNPVKLQRSIQIHREGFS
jgi:hypothetical protein